MGGGGIKTRSVTTSEKLDAFASQLEAVFTNEIENTVFDEEVKTDVDAELDQPYARARLTYQQVIPFDPDIHPDRIRFGEVTDILGKVNTRKACGPDHITNKIICYLLPTLHIIIQELTNICVYHGYRPRAWKRAWALMIHKPSKRRSIAINNGVLQGSPISPLLFLLYFSKLPNLVTNTRRSLFADDFMIYTESSITDSHLIQSNLQTSLDKVTVFNADHHIILSCTKSVRVLFERRKSKKLKPQDVSYNGQVIPASSSVKFLGITFDSALTFKSHYHTLANIARHHLLKMNSIFISTYVSSTSTLILLYKSYIRSLFDYGDPATCFASPHAQRIYGRGYKHTS